MSQKYSVSDILIEFLEVAIHSIIYSRQLYPSTIFQSKRKYGVPIKISTHPQLNLHISQCLTCAQELLKRKELQKVSVVLINNSLEPIQSFIFDILKLPSLSDLKDQYLITCEEALRAFCLKIGMVCDNMQPLPKGTSFRIHILTTEYAQTTVSNDEKFKIFPWVEVTRNSEPPTRKDSIAPVHALDTEFMVIQMYVEQ